MASYRFTTQARADLQALSEYLTEQAGPDRAERVLREIFDAAAKLAEMPGMGHRREDLTERPVLFWSVHGYLLIYRPETFPLEFIHVVSGFREVEATLARGK